MEYWVCKRKIQYSSNASLIRAIGQECRRKSYSGNLSLSLYCRTPQHWEDWGCDGGS
jgi:hypothetical protein